MFFIISFIISLFLLDNNKNWVELFNGNNLDGWEIKITGYKLGKNYRNTFKVKDGAITVSYEDYKSLEEDLVIYSTQKMNFKITY